jgi:hypothetical protein
MNPHDLVHELGNRLNLTGLSLSNGICRLMFDRSLPIDIEDDGNGNLYYHCNLGPLPHQNREAVLASLMSAHLFGFETDGAAIGLHPKTNDLYLFRSLPIESLEVDGALKSLERFTQQAENWKKRLPTLAQENPPATPSASDQPDGLAMGAIRA